MEEMSLSQAIRTADLVSPMPAVAHQALQALVKDRERYTKLQPMESAPRDNKPVLLTFRSDLPERIAGFNGKDGVCVWHERLRLWVLDAPVTSCAGYFHSAWFLGWRHLPPGDGP